MDPAQFVLLLFVAAIIAVSIGIARLASNNSKVEFQKLKKESVQNKIYELGNEIEIISSLFDRQQIDEACERFFNVNQKLEQYSHADLSSIEWKNYLASVKSRKDEIMSFINSYYPQEYGFVVRNKLLENKTKIELQTLKGRKNTFITVLALTISLIIIISYYVITYQNPPP